MFYSILLIIVVLAQFCSDLTHSFVTYIGLRRQTPSFIHIPLSDHYWARYRPHYPLLTSYICHRNWFTRTFTTFRSFKFPAASFYISVGVVVSWPYSISGCITIDNFTDTRSSDIPRPCHSLKYIICSTSCILTSLNIDLVLRMVFLWVPTIPNLVGVG